LIVVANALMLYLAVAAIHDHVEKYG